MKYYALFWFIIHLTNKNLGNRKTAENQCGRYAITLFFQTPGWTHVVVSNGDSPWAFDFVRGMAQSEIYWNAFDEFGQCHLCETGYFLWRQPARFSKSRMLLYKSCAIWNTKNLAMAVFELGISDTALSSSFVDPQVKYRIMYTSGFFCFIS